MLCERGQLESTWEGHPAKPSLALASTRCIRRRWYNNSTEKVHKLTDRQGQTWPLSSRTDPPFATCSLSGLARSTRAGVSPGRARERSCNARASGLAGCRTDAPRRAAERRGNAHLRRVLRHVVLVRHLEDIRQQVKRLAGRHALHAGRSAWASASNFLDQEMRVNERERTFAAHTSRTTASSCPYCALRKSRSGMGTSPGRLTCFGSSGAALPFNRASSSAGLSFFGCAG